MKGRLSPTIRRQLANGGATQKGNPCDLCDREDHAAVIAGINLCSHHVALVESVKRDAVLGGFRHPETTLRMAVA